MLTVELVGHEVDRQHLANAPHARRVYLAVADGVQLQQLFEHHSVGADLARRYPDVKGFQGLHR